MSRVYLHYLLRVLGVACVALLGLAGGRTEISVAGPALIATGNSHACATTPGGFVRCWGANDMGQLGDGTTKRRGVPVRVVGVSAAIGLIVGEDHSCALSSDGSIRCWGDNSSGELGDGTLTTSPTPVLVPLAPLTIR